MAKNTKDLFQLLQKRRSKGSFKIDPDPEPRQPLDLPGLIGGWYRSLVGGRPRGAVKRRMHRGPAGILVSGPTLAGLAFGSLVVGFLLGQELGSSGPEELQAAGIDKVQPGWLPPSGTEAGVLPADLQHQVLGDHVYLLAHFPVGSDVQASRNAADRLATYLRARGLERTRIHKFRWPDGSNAWLTLYYTQGPGIEQAVLDRIRSLEPPPFEPRWRQVLERLALHPEPARLTGS